jgi:uncharacterized protein CbrC (UPF0167 family)
MTQEEKFNLDLPKPGFRGWLYAKWLEHKDEVLATTGQPCDYDLGLYFAKYRWWLRRLYKETRND